MLEADDETTEALLAGSDKTRKAELVTLPGVSGLAARWLDPSFL